MGSSSGSPAGSPPGSRISVEKRKEGFHTSFETVRAAREIRLLPMETKKAGSRTGLDAGTAPRPGRRPAAVHAAVDCFFSFGNYFYVQPPLTAAGQPVYHNDASLCVGTYLFFPSRLSPAVRCFHGRGVDPLGPHGSGRSQLCRPLLERPRWWLETKILGPVIFLRQEWKYTTGDGPSLLGKRWMMVDNVPLMTLGVMFRW